MISDEIYTFLVASVLIAGVVGVGFLLLMLARLMKRYNIWNAAKNGEAWAQCYWGRHLLQKKGREKEAVRWLQKATEQEDGEAMALLASCYLNAFGVDPNERRAIQLLVASVRQGCAFGQYLLGVCYLKGRGVKPHVRKAVNLFRLSAEQGDEDGERAYLSCTNTTSHKPFLWQQKVDETELRKYDPLDAPEYPFFPNSLLMSNPHARRH